MGVLFQDGFDGYTADADLSDRWDTVNAAEFDLETTGGRWGGGSVRLFDDSALSLFKNFEHTPDGDEICFGMNIKYRSAFDVSTGGEPLLYFWGGDGSVNCSLWIDTTGHLYVRRGTTSTTAGTATTALSLDTWHWVEIRLKLNQEAASDGEVEVYLDDTQEINTTTADLTADASSDGDLRGVSIYGPDVSASEGIQMDDFVIWKLSGNAPNTFPLGPSRIQTLFVDGDGTTSDGTPSGGGANWDELDEFPSDGTTYNAFSTGGDLDLYTVDDMGVIPETVHNVAVKTRARATSTKDKDYIGIAKSGSTTGDAANGGMIAPLSDTGWRETDFHFPTNPDTAAEWTSAQLDAAEFGVKNVV